MASSVGQMPGSLPAVSGPSSPRVTVDRPVERDSPGPTPAASAADAAGLRGFSSPMRQHRRTPSAHREIKETLDARVEFTSDEADGRTYHRVNQYIIVEEIGRGSYGAVHRAVDQFSNEFAIKEFSKTRLRKRAQSHLLRQGPHGLPRHMLGRAGRADGPQMSSLRAGERNDALFLIREEIAIMKKLNHPNLVQLIEVLDDPEEDSMYMVLEMCKKGVVMRVGLEGAAEPYDDETCRHRFRDLILGIEYLHAQGVIHRDIKPDNLLLSEDDVLKVVDFGVSEMFAKSDDMVTAKSAGSPAFLPPELCGKHREVSGKAADIWSMGVSLFCLKYGRLPFNRPGILEIYEAIKSDRPDVPPGEDPNFLDLMDRILDKDPDRRITMAELRDHAWVTKDGKDPLLSAEENCAHLVEPPNELELNRAFTRKMNHLLCVMKAIHQFKARLAAIRSRTRGLADGPPAPPRHVADEAAAAAVAEETAKTREIEALLHRRHSLLSQVEVEGPERGLAEQAAEQEPLFLGIGTGARDDFAMDAATPDVVADSPTAVDFDIYDRAYEDAVQRQMRSGRASKPTLYLTKFVKEAEQLGGLAEGGLLAEARESRRYLQQRLAPPSGGKLAQLVSRVGLADTQGPETRQQDE
ncbi:hypothetical protein CDD83_10096 [Cordyceps sp. RAO-2017]|nr:hypothetical protein CDD83_10096 [Cordyceps sp. RAO-2017]